jgi:hypothetical protein
MVDRCERDKGGWDRRLFAVAPELHHALILHLRILEKQRHCVIVHVDLPDPPQGIEVDGERCSIVVELSHERRLAQDAFVSEQRRETHRTPDLSGDTPLRFVDSEVRPKTETHVLGVMKAFSWSSPSSAFRNV